VSTSLSRCDVPPWILASAEFNEDPIPLEIQGVARGNRALFHRLDELAEAADRERTFHEYMSVKFYLHQWDDEAHSSSRRALKNSYLRFLRGWGVDSNSIEGAVLKGWVESRFGITPTYHRGPLAQVDHDDTTDYAFDRMRGSARTNDVNGQLDLVYAFTQYELRRAAPERRWLRLFRGTYDASEHAIVATFSRREYVVRLNNLVSFTAERERAWEFGTTVWEVQVPTCKICFYGDLFANGLLRGEGEYLVIGGEYRVKELLA
jgi:NAD+--dinitrogen-reductase ADP-D-ribosyltransferase